MNLYFLIILIYSIVFIQSSNQFLIVKNTLWCGMGNDAIDCHDLGKLKETDSCCRSHDLCPYKYSTKNRTHNGFYWSKFYSLSHCECDLMFKNCLEEEPIKQGSAKVWHKFTSIGVKCYAFLPCTEESIKFSNSHERDKGECVHGTRVIVFDSIHDYENYLITNLDLKQRDELKNLLSDNLDRFYVRKSKLNKYLKCLNETFEYKNKIVENYSKRYLTNNNNSPVSMTDLNGKINLEKQYELEQENKNKLVNKLKDGILKIISIFT